MTRQLRPRPPVFVGAAFVSQLTSLPLLGIDARRFLDLVVPLCKPDVAHVGKLRLVELSRAVEALRRLRDDEEQPATVPSSDHEPDERQPETCDEALRALGYTRKP